MDNEDDKLMQIAYRITDILNQELENKRINNGEALSILISIIIGHVRSALPHIPKESHFEFIKDQVQGLSDMIKSNLLMELFIPDQESDNETIH